jgi:general stress protein 26
MCFERRDILVGGSAAGLIGVLAAEAARGATGRGLSEDIFRTDDAATIMATARDIIKEDWVGVLITIDEEGLPRARPVGVNDPMDDWSLWMSTRRGSRKTKQIQANPRAALHFGFDDISNGTKNSFYASFSGLASVHVDASTIAAHGPPEQYRAQWPDYPNDLALIRLRPQRLEVMGKGIKPNQQHWQPQGVALPFKD